MSSHFLLYLLVSPVQQPENVRSELENRCSLCLAQTRPSIAQFSQPSDQVKATSTGFPEGKEAGGASITNKHLLF